MDHPTMKKYILSALLLLAITANSLSASILPPKKNVYHVAPPSWFIGFQNPQLEIILHAENINLYNIVLNPYDGVTLDTILQSANRHVCYLKVNISPKTLR
jgi:hypothetical protein